MYLKDIQKIKYNHVHIVKFVLMYKNIQYYTVYLDILRPKICFENSKKLKVKKQKET